VQKWHNLCMGWWNKTREAPIVTRRAEPADRPLLNGLFQYGNRTFGHRAIEEQVALLSSGFSRLAVTDGQAVAFLGIHGRESTGPDTWSDLSAAAIAGNWPAGGVIPRLVDAATPALAEAGTEGLACLTSERWLIEALRQSRFSESDYVLTYSRRRRQPICLPRQVAELRLAHPGDAETIIRLNDAAFSGLWRYEPATLLSWLLTADHAMVAEVDGRAVGFALTSTTGRNAYAQLVRIATHPSVQGQGIGRQLVADAIAYADEQDLPGIALNTQASNSVSRHLYETMGFAPTSPSLTVLLLPLQR
jgi:GNAT superfamily N-acetyltransferase